VFGDRKKRVAKLSAGAQRNLEPGEEIHDVVQVQTGRSAAANATAVEVSGLVSAETGLPYRSPTKATPHLLVATDRNLYAMRLSGGRLLDVGNVVLKVPLDQAELRHEKNTLSFGGETFYVMGLFGEHAARLADHVAAHGAAS
jgi:hypothetical protein